MTEPNRPSIDRRRHAWPGGHQSPQSDSIVDDLTMWTVLTRHKHQSEGSCSRTPDRGAALSFDVTQERDFPAAAHRQHVGDCHLVEDIRHGVADFAHGKAHRAGFDIDAILAGLIGRPAGASDRRQRAIEGSDHQPDIDLVWRTGQHVATTRALLAEDDARVAKVAEDRVQEFLRDVVGFGNIDRLRGFPGRQRGEVDEGLEAVFSLGGQHRWRRWSNPNRREVRGISVR